MLITKRPSAKGRRAKIMHNLIDEKDLLRESDRVAVEVINDIIGYCFIEQLEYLSKGTGIGTDFGLCFLG